MNVLKQGTRPNKGGSFRKIKANANKEDGERLREKKEREREREREVFFVCVCVCVPVRLFLPSLSLEVVEHHPESSQHSVSSTVSRQQSRCTLQGNAWSHSSFLKYENGAVECNAVLSAALERERERERERVQRYRTEDKHCFSLFS